MLSANGLDNFKFTIASTNTTCKCITDLTEEIQHLKEKVKTCTNEIEELNLQLQEYEQNKYSLDKIKDDNKAMLFYTGFSNYGIFESVFGYLQSKAEKLQYWRGKSEVTDSKSYQNQGSKPG